MRESEQKRKFMEDKAKKRERERWKWKKTRQVQEKMALLNPALFHEDQWAKYGCNKKRSKNTIFEDHIQWWAKTSNTYQRNQKHRKWNRNKTCIYIIRFSKTTLWPFNVHSKQQTTNNQQHPKTSRKDRNKSMKVEKNPKHTPIIPEITPLCFASVKVLSFSSSCRTRSSVTNHKHVIFPITQ